MMHTSLFGLIIVLGSSLLLNSCRTLNTDISVPSYQIPESFTGNVSADTNTISKIHWKEYFADSILIQLIDSALILNQDLQIALQKIEMIRANTQKASGAQLPSVNLNIGGGMRRFGLYTMDGAGNATTDIIPGKRVPENLPDMFLGLTASWEVDLWGKFENAKLSSLSQFLAGVEGVNFVISNLVAEIALQYYQLLSLDNSQKIIEKTIITQIEAINVLNSQKQSGRANELAISQFESQLFDLKAMLRDIQREIIETENNLNYLIGHYPKAMNRNTASLLVQSQSSLLTGIPAQLLENRPDIREAEFMVKSAEYDVKSAKAAFYPSLQITASLGYQAFDPELLFRTPASTVYTLLGGLLAPIINTKALEADFNSALSNQMSALFHYHKTVLKSFVEVANGLSNSNALLEIYELKQQQKESLEKAVSVSNELFKYSKANYLEVLIARQSSLQAQLDVIEIAKRKKISEIQVYKALGGGWR